MLIHGISTGFMELDLLINGLHPGDLIVIAGTTGVGKTSLALGIAQYTAIDTQKTAAFFSLETSEETIISRILCSEGRIDTHRAMTGFMNQDEWQRLIDAQARLAEAPFYLNNTSFSIAGIKDKARELHDEIGLELIVIDYVQLISSEPQPFGYRLSRELKQLAKELAVPVIAVSQLATAKLEKRIDRRPQLSDFGYDDSLRQDADIIIFIHREDMYDRKEENAGVANLIVPKHRNGRTGTINVAFIKEFVRFANMWKEQSDADDAIAKEHSSLDEETKIVLASIISHSQDHLIRLTENKNIADTNYTLSIFKSPQERDFYEAVVAIFPGLSVYPNVALNCLFEFNKIKYHLTREEKNFFFKGTIDCVVFDEDNMPKFFFELDSSHHDAPEQQIKDEYKNNIFSFAGQKLYRIRRIAPNLGQKEFERLIREIFEKPN